MKLANNFPFSNSALKFLRHHSVILFHPLSTHLTIYAIWCFLRRGYVVENHFQSELRFDKNKVCKSLIARLLKIVKSSTSIGQHFLYILNKHKNPNNVRVSMQGVTKWNMEYHHISIICNNSRKLKSLYFYFLALDTSPSLACIFLYLKMAFKYVYCVSCINLTTPTKRK